MCYIVPCLFVWAVCWLYIYPAVSAFVAAFTLYAPTEHRIMIEGLPTLYSREQNIPFPRTYPNTHTGGSCSQAADSAACTVRALAI